MPISLVFFCDEMCRFHKTGSFSAVVCCMKNGSEFLNC